MHIFHVYFIYDNVFSVHKQLTLKLQHSETLTELRPICKWVQLYNTVFTAIMFIYNAKKYLKRKKSNGVKKIWKHKNGNDVP